ncbi:MAG: type I pullulanase [Agathobacter sp.]|nr:type I pullulanase [Agathobacter sp.]
MKKRLLAILLVLVMVVSTLSACNGNPDNTETGNTQTEGSETGSEDVVAKPLTVKLHYHRADGNYENWTVWGWEEGTAGESYPFVEEDGDMVATIIVDAGAPKLGYIVRLGNWEQKDIAEDQFIEVAQYLGGTIHVYVESGVAGHTIKEADDVVTGTKLVSAKYDGSKIAVNIAGDKVELTKESFVIKGSEGNVEITEVSGSGSNVVVKVAKELDLMKSYTITFAGTTVGIQMPDFYSTTEFESKYTYTGTDLGANWSKSATTFRVWAPTAESVKVNLYQSGTKGTNDLIKSIDMKADVNGTWVATETGDLNGTYYTYSVNVNGSVREACDPYARTTGVNGDRAMVIDLDSTDPEGWDKDKNPNASLAFNDAVIYELHIRDLSTDASAGITNIGKYLGLTEHGTKTPGGVATGIDHIKDLGITHLHLLPVYDYGSVDETKLNTPQFNWGYDPENYNVPEGSYSTDPYNGEVRVKEFKQMVQSLHNDGISVVMDVVYNHVYDAQGYCFNNIVPEYFSRVSNGVYSQGSGCGNDTASERSMVSKYIVDSILYWVEEYHIDGFRFDLVGLIDTKTINTIMEEVHKIRPDVVFYGEGWTMSTNVTKFGYTMTTQTNSQMVPGFAFFSDTIRDAIKGSVFDTGAGYVSGASGKASTITQCLIGFAGGWCKTPAQAINYASCHDNNTLFDRLQISRKDASKEDLIKMNNLAAAIYMTAQGIPFMQAGEEMLRTKVNADGSFNENSYNATDAVNSIKWSTLEDDTYQDVVNYYKGLIAFRKAHGALRLTNATDVNNHVTKISGLPTNVVAVNISGGVNGETAKNIYVVFNANNTDASITLPEGNWNVYVNADNAGTTVLGTVSGTITVEAISALVLVQE